MKTSRIYHWFRAICLTVAITRRPWWDKHEPYCNIDLRTAWEIAGILWLDRLEA